MNRTAPILNSLSQLIPEIPQSWLNLTTHRLDTYNEPLAKSEFLSEFKKLMASGDYSSESLEQLPTAYDYIRLGHQLSSVLEWFLSEINGLADEQVIAFDSKTMPILAVLRTNLLSDQSTVIYHDCDYSPLIDVNRLENIYGYKFALKKIVSSSQIDNHDESTVIFVTQKNLSQPINIPKSCDISINLCQDFGSVMMIHNSIMNKIIGDVQHVRRRETIAMTPSNCLGLIKSWKNAETKHQPNKTEQNIQIVHKCIQENTGSNLTPMIASSGLSIQYAILMAFIEKARIHNPDKPIKIILPPNCYGGTNDQTRRVANLIPNVGIIDLLVDGGEDLVNSLDKALNVVARVNGVPIVLAEIPTNPRVEVPDLKNLAETLSVDRFNQTNNVAVKPYFMVDQTFCPNVKLLDKNSHLSQVKTISFASGSKFPSGGRCVAGYCAANTLAQNTLELISKHLVLSDNEANADQVLTLAANMPSMPTRIIKAYKKTHSFVRFIKKLLPESKIYYVTDDIAQQGFMPSVFSLDLPVSAETADLRNEYQKRLNNKLIEFMIKAHPKTCKNCVSYGQLKGVYWTIPATSTQGTTKEDDKDYVVRVALSPETDVVSLSNSMEQFCRLEGLI